MVGNKKPGRAAYHLQGADREAKDHSARLGATRVVLPESEAGRRRLARELTIPRILDQLVLDPEHSIVELTTTEAYTGRTLREALICAGASARRCWRCASWR